MPTYEYQCESCGHRFERFQSIKADPLSECEICKGKARRLISAGGGLIFKGSGFYITDYRSEGYKAQSKRDNGGDSSTSSTATSKETTAKTTT
ncbi:MAG TPA: zinc ribbon domain-containing protein [Candidatus Latescibacteria bacterium]|nr:zinc ribbon domain-containing protein [Candidatus Latescibacterota bacterium]